MEQQGPPAAAAAAPAPGSPESNELPSAGSGSELSFDALFNVAAEGLVSPPPTGADGSGTHGGGGTSELLSSGNDPWMSSGTPAPLSPVPTWVSGSEPATPPGTAGPQHQLPGGALPETPPSSATVQGAAPAPVPDLLPLGASLPHFVPAFSAQPPAAAAAPAAAEPAGPPAAPAAPQAAATPPTAPLRGARQPPRHAAGAASLLAQQLRRGAAAHPQPLRAYRWEHIQTDDAPATRGRHTMGVDEERGVMVIFGGQNYDLRKKYSNVARFDLGSARWLTTEEEFDHGPCARSSHASVATKDSLFVFGGATGVSFLSSPGCCKGAGAWRFDHKNSEWSKLELAGLDQVCSRYGHTTVLAPGNRVYLFGGMTDAGCDSSTYLIDLEKGLVQKLSCTYVGTEGDVCGPVGTDAPQQQQQQHQPGAAEAGLSPAAAAAAAAASTAATAAAAAAAGLLPAVPPTPASALAAAAATLAAQAATGPGSGAPPGAASAAAATATAAAVGAIAELVDPSSAGHALALAQEAVANIGSAAAQEVLVELLEDVVDLFVRDGSVPYTPKVTAQQVRERVRGFGHTAVYNKNNHSMYVMGGTVDGRRYHSAFLRLDLATNRWMVEQSANKPPQGRYVHCAAMDDRRNAMYVFGGYCGSYTNDIHEYSFGTKRWRQIRPHASSPAPALRSGACAVVWGDHLYVFGGCDDSQYYADVWRMRLWNDTISLKDTMLELVAWHEATGAMQELGEAEVPAGVREALQSRRELNRQLLGARAGGRGDARN
eukprot:TRINITY_DN4692_c1_g3_i4.p1 TRINITY_DN4692_c1_g3~~TRINITY_DN4692_c1_g3_i4.p1  ORF type:complete len:805 (+),score=222.44 TRINITY_DN4692_c1_g3_i4:105-2417(+)